MSTIAELIDKVVEDLKTIGGVKSVESFGGRFDLQELKKFGAAAPAIRVAAIEIGATRTVDTGEMQLDIKMLAIIVTRDAPGTKRDKAASDIATAVIARAHLATWGATASSPANKITAQNLYTGTLQETGVALWGVTWITKLRIGTSAYALPEGEVAQITELNANEHVTIGSGELPQ